ncbi:alpha/beta fold hydrolase [Paraburkholderia kirstenboschensis]|uniref:Alpha/beta hydrolase n=1 Tax=Paraburkholderia kirstenboschensis TaxID=1245436 RepID=A0ABZ0EEV1_9BURK|nr:alpha/beta hydrolase [Paraburkholderia kirstenboschensis]WOD15051.1 alpha/beta hydrolase [Paraburkholderia kirstenboschensis]
MPACFEYSSYAKAQNNQTRAGGTTFAYRELGPHGGIPLILLNHWGAVLDNFDPRIVDSLARKHRVIAIDYRGIGSSGGIAPVSVDEMARDTIALLRQLKAIKGWGQQAPQDLTHLHMPVLIANGDKDIMVSTALSHDMARRIPNAQFVIYQDAGHGGICQYHTDFVIKALEFPAQ